MDILVAQIRQITLQNFKRFDRFTLGCRAHNILVGPNNAGKSSILDAFRILYGALRYARRLNPKIFRSGNSDIWGYEIPDNSIPIGLQNVARNYTDEPAKIEFKHKNGNTLVLEIHPDHLTRLHIKEAKRSSTNGRSYFAAFPVDIVIVPTLSPFEQDEPYVVDATVERNRASRLSSRHFRNIWSRASTEDFSVFAQLVEDTWPGVTIGPPHLPSGRDVHFEMFFKEGRFDREISWSGFGFQVWLQILTHMLRGTKDSIFILDEPDIYIHPDLQRKLLRILNERFSQFFLATHSSEIINNSLPGDIVTVNSSYRVAKRIESDEDYNSVFAYIGSIDNVDLSRLARAKRVIFFEGDDRKVLAQFCKKLNVCRSIVSGDELIIKMGGFGRWKRAIEAAWTFRNILKVDVNIIAVFDRDYRDSRDIEEMKKAFSDENIHCVVWNRKEIENYYLHPEAIKVAIEKKLTSKGRVSAMDLDDMLLQLSNQYKHTVIGQMAANRVDYERRCGGKRDYGTITEQCSAEISAYWDDGYKRFYVIPGKQFIADISSYTQENFGFSISMNEIIAEFNSDIIDPVFAATLREIEAFCDSR